MYSLRKRKHSLYSKKKNGIGAIINYIKPCELKENDKEKREKISRE